MRKFALILFSCFACVSGAAAIAASQRSSVEQAETPRAAVERISSEHAVPSVVLTFVEGGEVAETIALGTESLDSEDQVLPTSVFQIASVSKVFTGIITSNLVRDGLLDPARPVLDYLPADLSEDARKNLAGVTLAHVLHHRSGLPRDTAVHPREGNDPMVHPLTEVDLLQDLAIAEMVGAPGETYEYSNLGYGLLGYVLERASGHSYEALVERYVTQPYALTDTGTRLDPDAQGRLVTPFRKEDPLTPTKPWRTGKLVAASGLYSTPADLAKLLTAQLSAYTSRDEASGALVLTNTTMPVSDGRSYGFGLNVQSVQVGEETHRLHFHSGDMDGYAAFYGFIPSHDSGFVLLVSRGGAGKEQLQRYALKRILGLS